MKPIKLIVVFIGLTVNLYAQQYNRVNQELPSMYTTQQTFKIYNSSTKELVKDEDGVVVRVKYEYFEIWWDNYQYSILRPKNQAYRNNYYVKLFELGSYDENIKNGTMIFNMPNLIHIEYSFESPNYKTYTLKTDYLSIGNMDFHKFSPDYDNLYSQIRNDLPETNGEHWNFPSEVYLIPNKTIIEGNLNIRTQVESKSLENLGLLSTKIISEGLSISEEDVIKLITSNQLKGKKIGEKYFVRKEDFDAFMKK